VGKHTGATINKMKIGTFKGIISFIYLLTFYLTMLSSQAIERRMMEES
jgi:hypothetical protein